MTILHIGKAPDKYIYGSCPGCSCVFIVTQGDIDQRLARSPDPVRARSAGSFECPTCGELVRLMNHEKSPT